MASDLPAEVRECLQLWAFAFFLSGFLCGALTHAWLDYRALKRRQKAQGRLKLPCHVWLAVAPWVLVQSPWVVFLALLVVGALLILWMGVATMSATQDRAAEAEGQSRNAERAGPETAARWGQRALPEQPFTGVDPL